jgi:hypothetical protein
VIDEDDIQDRGFHPRAASVIRAKELLGHDSIPTVAINHMHPLQELLRQGQDLAYCRLAFGS